MLSNSLIPMSLLARGNAGRDLHAMLSQPILANYPEGLS